MEYVDRFVREGIEWLGEGGKLEERGWVGREGVGAEYIHKMYCNSLYNNCPDKDNLDC